MNTELSVPHPWLSLSFNFFSSSYHLLILFFCLFSVLPSFQFLQNIFIHLAILFYFLFSSAFDQCFILSLYLYSFIINIILYAHICTYVYIFYLLLSYILYFVLSIFLKLFEWPLYEEFGKQHKDGGQSISVVRAAGREVYDEDSQSGVISWRKIFTHLNSLLVSNETKCAHIKFFFCINRRCLTISLSILMNRSLQHQVC